MRNALAGLLVVGLAATASANGRDPYTSTINFRAGNENHIVAGMTFGVVLSKDGGATWQWMCERAVGYGGMYDTDHELGITSTAIDCNGVLACFGNPAADGAPDAGTITEAARRRLLRHRERKILCTAQLARGRRLASP